MTPLLIGTAACTVLLALLEWMRRDATRRLARVAAVTAATLALSALLVQHRARPSADPVVIATEGATPGDARHLADSLGAAIVVLPGAGDPRRFGPGAISAADAAAGTSTGAPAGERNPRVVAITGWGLDDAELDALATAPVAFTPAAVPAGFALAEWPRHIDLGTELGVRGSVSAAAPGDVVRLDDPAGAADSASVSPDSPQFALVARPRAEGAIRYVLRLLRAGRTVAADTVGVDVRRRAPPRLLIIDGAPSFETKYLREWAARSGGSVSTRVTVSRDRYRTLHVNAAPIDLRTLSTAALAAYDVVIADGAAMAALGGVERRALIESVREGGLGLVVRGDASIAGSDAGGVLAGFRIRAKPGATAAAVRPIWRAARTIPPVVAEPVSLAVSGGQALIRDTAGAVFAAWRPLGAGAVAVTAIATPSRWQLAGNRETFGAYWSLLISAVARSPAPGWEIPAPGPVIADQPAELRHDAMSAPSAIVQLDDGSSDTVFLAEDRVIAGSGEARYWPRRAGWNAIGAGDDALRFDVRGSEEWTSWRAARRVLATRNRVAGSGRRGAEPAPRRERRLPVPEWLLFLVFVGAAAFLWMSPPRPAA